MVFIVLFDVFVANILSVATTMSLLPSVNLDINTYAYAHALQSQSQLQTQAQTQAQAQHDTIDLFDNSSYNNYIKVFWVGLMDGDGSIQLNHLRSKSLQYRLIIKLSNLKSNYHMLIKIAKVIGGTVIITNNDADVIWVVNKKEDIKEIIKIYNTYPPLTSRIVCQLAFLKACLTETSRNAYLLNRNQKYNKQLNMKISNVNFKAPFYFKGWLSGFIEAKGCFSVRKNNNHSFSIGHNYDFYLIDAIKQFLGVTNQIINPYAKFYFLEIYKKQVLLNIINHCANYPLMGGKLESLNKIKSNQTKPNQAKQKLPC